MDQSPNLQEITSQDKRLIVKLGVEMNPKMRGESLSQTLNNGVEITALGISENCHFIQLITKQCTGDSTQFATFEPNYMRDKDTPRWAIDSVARKEFEDVVRDTTKFIFRYQYGHNPEDFKPPYNPFYDEGGASFKEEGKLAMFDQPGLGSKQERVIFATFLIEDNKATKMVLWSREWEKLHGQDSQMVYHCYGIKNIDVFPLWAIKAMRDEYQTNGAFKDFEKTQYVSMNFNETLLKIQNLQPPLPAEEERRVLLESFPPPSPNWDSKLNVLYHQPTSSTVRMMSMGIASTHPTPDIPEPEVKKDVKVEEKKISAHTLSIPQTEQREDKTNDKGDEPKQGFTPTGM